MSKENIWPSVVKALNYLINHSKMYQQENITMDNNWLDSLGYANETNKQYFNCQNEETCECDSCVSNRNSSKSISECSNSESGESNDDFNEIDYSECNTGNMDTILHSQNQHVKHLEYTSAPGVDKQLIFHEPLAEYLSFPTFFVERSD